MEGDGGRLRRPTLSDMDDDTDEGHLWPWLMVVQTRSRRPPPRLSALASTKGCLALTPSVGDLISFMAA